MATLYCIALVITRNQKDLCFTLVQSCLFSIHTVHIIRTQIHPYLESCSTEVSGMPFQANMHTIWQSVLFCCCWEGTEN